MIGHPLPGVVAILQSANASDPFASRFVCAGVVVDTYTVMTAAHCLTGRRPSSLEVRADVDDLCGETAATSSAFEVVRVRTSSTYNPSTGLGDVAELTVATKLANVRQVDRTAGAPIQGTAVGWGNANQTGRPTCRLSAAALAFQPEAKCSALIGLSGTTRVFDPESMMCGLPARGPDGDTCQGDSGGPVILGDLFVGPVIALVSWGRGCGRGYAGVYQRPELRT